MDILNTALKVQNNLIPFVLAGGKIWFRANNVAEVLGYRQPDVAISKKVKLKYKCTLRDLKIKYNINIDEDPRIKYINESGLYVLVMSSKQPLAEQFKDWVYETVIPTLRKQGHLAEKVLSNLQPVPYSTLKLKEKHVRDQIALETNGEIEVHIPDVGYIDILTEDSLIEVKSIRNWKHAVGQLLIYGSYYPDKKKILWTYGEDISTTKRDIIQFHCSQFEIQHVHDTCKI